MRKDLSRIDSVMNRLLSDETRWKQFIYDPNGTLIALGLHPPTRDDINQRCNAIMFATLCNQELLELTQRSAEGFFSSLENSPELRKYTETYESGLDAGEIRNDVDYDMAYFEYILQDESLLRQRYSVALNDINERRLLSKLYDREELSAYIGATVEAAKRYKSDVQLPVLEEWDGHYGIGKAFATSVFEVAYDVTLAAGFEALFSITSIGTTLTNNVITPTEVFLQGKYKRAAILSQILKLSSDLFVAAQSYRM
jgi:hypothetical protein